MIFTYSRILKLRRYCLRSPTFQKIYISFLINHLIWLSTMLKSSTGCFYLEIYSFDLTRFIEKITTQGNFALNDSRILHVFDGIVIRIISRNSGNIINSKREWRYKILYHSDMLNAILSYYSVCVCN